MRAQEFIAERTDPRLEIENMSTILPGDISEYFVRFTDQDKIGFSARQHFGRTPDIDDPNFDPLALPRPQGRPALWFYPLRTYLRHRDLYAGDMPYTWLVRIKPDAWLQPVDGKTSKQDAPPGKNRVGMLRRDQGIDMAVFFQPAFSVVDRWHTPTKQKQKFAEYKIDNRSGIGAVPKNQEIDYFGLRVAMRPSTFLKLALPLPNTPQDQESIEYVKQNKDSEGIGAPFLEIDIPEGWESGDLSKPARVVGHDGRHRMAAILQSEGDDPVEVHLFPLGLRRRHFEANPEWAQQLNRTIVGQRGNAVQGPIFQESGMNEALVSYLNTMEDFTGDPKSGSRPGSLKRKAAAYLGKDAGEKLSQTDLKRLRAKANKMKKSGNKAERQRGIQLSRQASWYDNFH